jgi:hypothetical protein
VEEANSSPKRGEKHPSEETRELYTTWWYKAKLLVDFIHPKDL